MPRKRRQRPLIQGPIHSSALSLSVLSWTQKSTIKIRTVIDGFAIPILSGLIGVDVDPPDPYALGKKHVAHVPKRQFLRFRGVLIRRNLI
jgi:hypothetical protein